MGYRHPPPLPPAPGFDRMTPEQKREVHRMDAAYHRDVVAMYRRPDERPSSGCGLGWALLGYLLGRES
jgi:hypothetical protein